MNLIRPAVSPWALRARSFSTPIVSSGSVVTDLVAASRKRNSRAGSVSMAPLSTFRVMEAMNICCRLIRPMSEPSPML